MLTFIAAPGYYITLILRGLGFDTFTTNLLVIPSQVLATLSMLALTYLAEVWGELSLTAMIGQIWVFPFIIVLSVLDINTINQWSAWVIITLLLSYPSGQFPPFGATSRAYGHCDNDSIGLF